MGFKEWIIPQDKVFFNLLEEQAEIVIGAAELFKKMISEYNSFGVAIKRMHALEHEGDEIVHKIFRRLNKSFITPIDQEDISKLDKEVVWQLSSLLNLFKDLHETAIDIGDLVIAKVNG